MTKVIGGQQSRRRGPDIGFVMPRWWWWIQQLLKQHIFVKKNKFSKKWISVPIRKTRKPATRKKPELKQISNMRMEFFHETHCKPFVIKRISFSDFSVHNNYENPKTSVVRVMNVSWYCYNVISREVNNDKHGHIHFRALC